VILFVLNKLTLTQSKHISGRERKGGGGGACKGGLEGLKVGPISSKVSMLKRTHGQFKVLLIKLHA
jgi:hypothetical protein